jgi:hypothetical protein
MKMQLITTSLRQVLKEVHANQSYRFKKEVLNEAKDENLSLLGRKFLNRMRKGRYYKHSNRCLPDKYSIWIGISFQFLVQFLIDFWVYRNDMSRLHIYIS